MVRVFLIPCLAGPRIIFLMRRDNPEIQQIDEVVDSREVFLLFSAFGAEPWRGVKIRKGNRRGRKGEPQEKAVRAPIMPVGRLIKGGPP